MTEENKTLPPTPSSRPGQASRRGGSARGRGRGGGSGQGGGNRERGSFFTKPVDTGWDYKTLEVKRVTRVIAGGKRFKIRVVVISGTRDGQVGVGLGKGDDVAQAVEKARRAAERSAIVFPVIKGSIPFEVTGQLGSGRVLIKPAASGRGLIAGGASRIVLELAGVQNATAKILSNTKNPLVNTRACLVALQKLNQYPIKIVSQTEPPVLKSETPTETVVSEVIPEAQS